jgi:hypothetical protein
MMVKRAITVTQPYKFLDYYGFGDRHIFFGRERETEILLSDVIATRLVVLFAKTGTGKTSLINAGVRPRLEELDYATFYIRVEKDPAESVRKALRKKNLLPSKLEGQSLATQLEYAVTQLEQPVVVFFDQFEEFFIYVFKEDPEQAHQFISDIAKVYRNRESGVHIVFSMREEFFVEMDAFRDEIPSIFHNDSNLRLRWFDEDQAREVIVGPARKFEAEIEEELVERLILDLAEGGRIEPTRLQIVCDTLWRERADGRILLADYERLGGAEQILNRRLEEDIGKKLKPGQLQLFEKLLPELTTERDTKYVRGFDELVKTLETDAASLRKLVDQLRKLRLLRESTHYGALYIEWTSDYLAERTDYLQKRVKAISLRRLLQAAIDRAELKKAELAEQGSLTDTPWIEATTKDDREALYMAQRDFEDISEGSALLKYLSQAEAEFLFVAALEHGTDTSHWFRKAYQSGVEVWQILTDRIEHGEAQSKQVENAIYLLGELKDEQAMKLLEAALHRDVLASQAINELRRMKTKEAIELLAMALRQEGTSALRAGMALNSMASVQIDEEDVLYDLAKIARQQAKAALDEVLARQAKSLFLLALERGLDMRFWFGKAAENGVKVWEILSEKIVNRYVPIEQAENAIRLLVELEDEQARELLEIASQRDALAQSAKKAFSARKALENIRIKRQLPGQPIGDRGLKEHDWALLLRRIKDGKCTPFLGAGVNFGMLPLASEIALKWAQEYRYPLEDAGDLSRVAQFLAVQYDPMFPKEGILRQFFESVAPPDFTDPNEPHGVLADLPLPVYMTTNYDDFMMQALRSRHKDPRRELCRWNQFVEDQPSIFESEPGFRPTVAGPVVFHLHGHSEVVESLVLTEDDYLDFLVNISRERDLLPPRIQEALTGASLLFIGYSLTDRAFQVLFRGLVMSTEPSLRRISVAVQLPPVSAVEQKYVDQYFNRIDLRVYWGTAREFAAELRQRCQREGIL